MSMLALAYQVPQFACSSTACVGWVGGASGGPDAATTALFTTLQKQINASATILGTKKVKVDGKIGSDTLVGYNAIIAYLTQKGTQYLLLPVKDFRHLANLAWVIASNLEGYAPYFKGIAPPPKAPSVPFPSGGGGGGETSEPTVPAAGPNGPMSATEKAKTFAIKNKLYVLGGLGILAVGTYAIFFTDKAAKADKKEAAATGPGVSGARYGDRYRGWRY